MNDFDWPPGVRVSERGPDEVAELPGGKYTIVLYNGGEWADLFEDDRLLDFEDTTEFVPETVRGWLVRYA